MYGSVYYGRVGALSPRCARRRAAAGRWTLASAQPARPLLPQNDGSAPCLSSLPAASTCWVGDCYATEVAAITPAKMNQAGLRVSATVETQQPVTTADEPHHSQNIGTKGAMHVVQGQRPVSARTRRCVHRPVVARPPSARSSRPRKTQQQALRIPPHPPTEPRATSASSRTENRSRSGGAQFCPGNQVEKVRKRGQRRQNGQAQKVQLVVDTDVECAEMEPTGSFRRRHIAHAQLAPKRCGSSRAKNKTKHVEGVHWEHLKSGLTGLFRSRSRVYRGSRLKTAWKQYGLVGNVRTGPAAEMSAPRQKELKKKINALNDHYELGDAARVLNHVDKTFIKRQRCGSCGSCGKCLPDCQAESTDSGAKVTRQWVGELERARRDLVPWTTIAEPKRTWETVDERRARLRQEIVQKRQEKEKRKLGGDNDLNGRLALKSVEHASLSLQLALQREAAENRKTQVRDKLDKNTQQVVTNNTSSVTACIRALNELAQTNYIENQRDVAAALYSLSINDENKPAFIEAKALSTLVNMSETKDADTRRKVAGAMYHLAMSRKVKRALVKIGALKPLLAFSIAKDNQIKRYSMFAIKELCGKRFLIELIVWHIVSYSACVCRTPRQSQ